MSEAPKKTIRRCNHGPNGICQHCLKDKVQQVKEVEQERRLNNIRTAQTLKAEMTHTTISGEPLPEYKSQVKGGAFRLANGQAIHGIIHVSNTHFATKTCSHGPDEDCEKCNPQKAVEKARAERLAKIKEKKLAKSGLKSSTSSPTPEPRKLSPHCRHGPREYCKYCVVVDKVAEEKKKEEEKKEYKKLLKDSRREKRNCPTCGSRGFCTACAMYYDSLRIEIELTKANVKLIKFAKKEVFGYQQYVFERDFHVNRYGILYGKFKENEIDVHAIFEPQQKIDENDEFVLLGNQQMKNVDEMCALIGLEKVGIVFSHKGGRKYDLSSRELCAAAKRQIEWDKRCITAVFGKKAECAIECFQASSQLVELMEEGKVLEIQKDLNMIELNDDVIVEKKKTKKVDATLFQSVVGVKPKEKGLMFPYPMFPIENRPDCEQTLIHFQKHFKEKMNGRPIYDQLLDFHLLVYCLDLGIFQSLEELRSCIIDRQEPKSVKQEIQQWLDYDLGM